MLRVAIIGCGKIADAHAVQLQRIQGCKIVGVCDREPLMARQLYERFPIDGYFSDVAKMLSEARPDVVHITTPPQSHFGLAKACLESGCHVYVEKPFTLNETEARALVKLATEKGLKITVGHDYQFTHVARRFRTLAQGGFLGGAPVHMESHYCYVINREGYSGALLGDPRHWVRKLPGKLLQNVISHGVARISEFLTDESPDVVAYGFVSPLLKSMGETEIIDELRVIISEKSGATAYFTFSSQMRPELHDFRIYGPKNGLVLNQDDETVIKLRGARYKSYLQMFVPPVVMAQQEFGNLFTNLKSFLARDFHMKSGMRYLIESFYRSIEDGTPPPIPYREIVLTAKIMDAIFAQVYAPAIQAGERAPIHSFRD